MCGIAGIVGARDPGNRDALARMSAAMVHRGPDAEGTWESPADERGWGVLLAHRRLAILDLSPAGTQPMIDAATGGVVVFNGEIYNYRDLRARLAAAGERFASSGDTAVLLRALGREGPSAVAALRGMFAFAYWDPRERTLLLARDALGIKPLYLARNPDPRAGWSLAFASELRALLASGLLGTPHLDPAAVASVVWSGFVVGPSTAVRGVELLDPGRLLAFDSSGREVASRRFWSMAKRPDEPAMDEETLAAVLEEDVRLHLASDVPLAIFLSGGIDSSAVANLVKRTATTPVHTFTLAFEEQELNEGPHARRIARAIGTEHREVVLTESDFVSRLEPALDALDQPTFDAINAYAMSQAIRAAGFTVALVGTGGDELFGGYPTFRELPILEGWLRRARFLPRGLLARAAGAATARWAAAGVVPPQTRWAKLADMIRRGDDLLGLYQLAYAMFLPDLQRRLIGDEVADALVDGVPRAQHARLAEETRGRSSVSAVSVLEHRLFLGERLLRDNDVASMAASIEQRVPLVDQVLFEHVDRVADRRRFRPAGRKALLRRIGLRGLDPGLFERPKSGFVLPFARWIRNGLRSAVDETLRDATSVAASGLDPHTVALLWKSFLAGAPGLTWTRVWALYVHVRWCHRNRVFAR
jgi:asparagine synthase (glutamine-hydrolysing)